MNIAGKTVITPADNPIGYPLDWRHQLAQAGLALAANGVRPQIQDADARSLFLHLQRRQKYPLKTGEKPTVLDNVLGWKESPASALVEAFLLASDTCQDAAAELGLPDKEIQMYGRLYFDVRDDQGVRRPGVLMRLLAELDAEDDDPAMRLRRIALTSGIHGLRRVLRAAVPAKETSLDQLVEAELTRRLHAGELRTGDLVRLQANAIARQRIAVETEDERDPAWMRSVQLVTSIMALTKPIIVQPNRDPEHLDATTQAIQGRIEAQRDVGATSVLDDPEKGIAALNQLMGRQFRPGEM